MDPVRTFCVLAFLVLGLAGLPLSVAVSGGGGGGFRGCGFKVVFNFGDSNSDTGAISAALSEVRSPNGQTFFGNPSGRFCDGRLIIDFIAEDFRLPYLSAYLDSLGTKFKSGANFATAGSSIRPGGFSPFHLGIQISQFLHFKSRVVALYNQPSTNRTTPPFKISIPRPTDFSKALYTFDIGQNDLSYGYQHMTEEEVRASIPNILDQFSEAVNLLYKEGARFFWIHNTGPLGCLPFNVISFKSKPGNFDLYGCVKPQNEMAQEFNRQLKDRVTQLRAQLVLGAFTYVDLYSAKYALISDAKNQGFADPLKFCCGSYHGTHIDCGEKAVVCDNPSIHISWDSIHYSEAANLWIAKRILNGSYSDPPVPIKEACHRPKSV